MTEIDVVSSTNNTYCVEYWKPSSPSEKKVLKKLNKSGKPISTKKFSEVYMFDRLQDTFPTAKHLMAEGYDVKIRKCCLAREDEYFLI
jgi:hypothetical protein